MFERFTERARRCVVLAQEEARMLDHNHIGTEHILLGLIHERQGVAARALQSLGITIEAARQQVEEIIGRGQEPPSGHIPFTPRAKTILERSLREALNAGSEVIGTEHLLLGLVGDPDGVGAQILDRLGAPAPAVRQAVASAAGAEPEGTKPEPGPRGSSMARAMRLRVDTLVEVKDLLLSIDRRLSAIENHLGLGTEPAEPGEQAGPADPGEPARRADPGEPAPGEPAGPAEPGQPAPGEPAGRANPGEPTEPRQPAEPGKPTEPGQPPAAAGQ